MPNIIKNERSENKVRNKNKRGSFMPNIIINERSENKERKIITVDGNIVKIEKTKMEKQFPVSTNDFVRLYLSITNLSGTLSIIPKIAKGKEKNLYVPVFSNIVNTDNAKVKFTENGNFMTDIDLKSADEDFQLEFEGNCDIDVIILINGVL